MKTNIIGGLPFNMIEEEDFVSRGPIHLDFNSELLCLHAKGEELNYWTDYQACTDSSMVTCQECLELIHS